MIDLNSTCIETDNGELRNCRCDDAYNKVMNGIIDCEEHRCPYDCDVCKFCLYYVVDCHYYSPSQAPSVALSGLPPIESSNEPSDQPSNQPSSKLSVEGSDQPTTQPSIMPSIAPTLYPTSNPTFTYMPMSYNAHSPIRKSYKSKSSIGQTNHLYV